MTRKLLFMIVFAACFAPGSVFPGPRWWWDDVAITATRQDGLNPDITLPVAGPNNPDDTIIVVWEETPQGELNPAIFLTASFDHGCTFCDPMQITDPQADGHHNPSVAAGVVEFTALQIHVAYETDAGETRVVYLADPPDLATLSCTELAAQVWGKALLNPVMLLGQKPDIAAAAFGNDVQFHVVWQQGDAIGNNLDDIYYAVDITGSGVYTAGVNLTDAPLEYDSDPAVSVDATPNNQIPPRRAVNIAYLAGDDDLPDTPRAVYYVRSIDSGTTFSIPVPVNDSEALQAPNIDSGDHKIFRNTDLWHGVAWMVPGNTPGFTTGVYFDSQYNSDAATVGFPWQSPDENFFTPLTLSGSDGWPPAVSVFPESDDGFYVFWHNRETFTPEIWFRGGVYDLTAGIDSSTFPIDGSVSSNRRLTGVAPPRPAGSAKTPASDERAEYAPCMDATAFVVWVDTSQGASDIFFKRIDTCVDPIPLTGQCNPDGGVDLLWDYPVCPAFPERLLALDVYFSTVSGGPYTLFTSLPPDANGVTVTSPPLVPATDYYFLVVATDQAGNMDPPDFDAGGMDPPPANEIMVFNGPPCEVVSVEKTWIDSDGGQLLPGETVLGSITVTNSTSGDATGVEVRDDPDLDTLENFNLQNGGVWEDADTILWDVGDIPPGESRTVGFEATVRCMVPDPQGGPDIEMADLTEICNDNFIVRTNEAGDILAAPPVCLTANRPVLGISKDMVTSGTIQAGDPTDWEITVCNDGSGTASDVGVADTIDQVNLDPATLSIGGGGTWNDPDIVWVIGSVASGSPTSPTCQVLTYTIDVRANTPPETLICNNASVTAEVTYSLCSWELPARVGDCFQTEATPENSLHKGCCGAAPCDLSGIFPLPPFKAIPAAPGQTDDTGLLDLSNRLCFYQVEESTTPNSLRLYENTSDPNTVDMEY